MGTFHIRHSKIMVADDTIAYVALCESLGHKSTRRSPTYLYVEASNISVCSYFTYLKLVIGTNDVRAYK